MYFTVDEAGDGVGAQLFRKLSAIAWGIANQYNYLHKRITGVHLSRNVEDPSQDEIEKINKIIDQFVINLGCDFFDPIKHLDIHHCMHKLEAVRDDASRCYSREVLKKISEAYPAKNPEYYGDHFNIAIHIRRGLDIESPYSEFYHLESTHKYRLIYDMSLYKNLINKLKIKYPQAKIHIFSWGNVDVGVESDDMIYHITDNPTKFVEDFNALATADLLVVGSSGFSMSAGFFNKNIVITNHDFCKILLAENGLVALPLHWFEDCNYILGT